MKTIKSYESTGRGHFAFEAGRSAPMGEGLYSFRTRVTQDVFMYDTLDKYVMEAAGLREVIILGSIYINNRKDINTSVPKPSSLSF